MSSKPGGLIVRDGAERNTLPTYPRLFREDSFRNNLSVLEFSIYSEGNEDLSRPRNRAG